MRRRKYHIGRLRIRAAALLAKAFPDWDVRPEDIVPASGSYRTCAYHDIYRWELFTRTRSGIPVVCGSWETLTEFVRFSARFGCHMDTDDVIYSNKREAEPCPTP